MVTLRCTKKLQDKLPATLRNVSPNQPSTTALGDWYITILHTRPKHLLLCVSEHSRLAVLFPAAPLSSLVPRFRQALGEALEALAISDDAIAEEQEEMAAFQFGPTQNRSHVGTLIEYVKTLQFVDGDRETRIHSVAKSTLEPDDLATSGVQDAGGSDAPVVDNGVCPIKC